MAPHSNPALPLLRQALSRRLGASVRGGGAIDDDSNLLDVGLVDSQGLLDLILEVEESCGLTFDPSRIDLGGGVTLAALAVAFA